MIKSGFELHGRNADVGATYEPIWTNSGAYTFPTSASALKIQSTDAEDDPEKAGGAAGTGLWTLLIVGLDSNYKTIVEEVQLNGTGKVDTTKEFLRVLEVKGLTCGTGLVAAGTITIKDSTETYTLAQIESGYSRAAQCIWTVPAGHNIRIHDIVISEDQSKQSEFALFFFEPGSNRPKIMSYESLYLLAQERRFHSDIGILFGEKTDFYLAAKSAGGAGNINASIFGILS